MSKSLHIIQLTCPSSSNAMITTAAPYLLMMVAFFTKSASPSFRLMELTMHFPWQHLSPASTTLKSEESMHRGTFDMSGSDAIRLQNLLIALQPSNIPSSMLMSKT